VPIFLFLSTADCVEPRDECFRVGRVRRRVERLRERQDRVADFLIGEARAVGHHRRALRPVERIHDEHRVAGFGEPLPHRAERGT
jgi:hypothetical protein